jgi:flagellar hook assembly protein FlgD
VAPLGGLGSIGEESTERESSSVAQFCAVGNPGSHPQLRFSLPEEASVDLAVYDVRGRLVSRITNTHLPAGDHQYLWYGMDTNGSQVASGVHFARLEIRGPNRPKVQTAKVVITR